MTLRKYIKKLSVLLDISEPQEVSPGVFETKLTHPKLKGELTFVHSEFVGRDQVLQALDENIVGRVLDVASIVGEIINGKAQTAQTSPSPPGKTPGSRGS